MGCSRPVRGRGDKASDPHLPLAPVDAVAGRCGAGLPQPVVCLLLQVLPAHERLVHNDQRPDVCAALLAHPPQVPLHTSCLAVSLSVRPNNEQVLLSEHMTWFLNKEVHHCP